MINFENYISPEVFVLIPALCIFGRMIKDSKAVKTKWIPLMLGGCGCLVAVLTMISEYGFNLSAIVAGIIQGFLCAGSAVYIHQLIKQSGK